ncbi:COG1590 daomin protein [Paecilomyces variotii No. 5]|uniref:tRNA(Phe) 7-[(3-amino-3-carboxypropyl)-4-demethylwyosine(37)-N(4)]-methyltransferase n=1 Tax=Byssochlamys spectabilis (strain No. 5 / NBRC 109023) TaxID=1356009 RepID=V5FJ96_BYSSN|nr:COG1590 daomin protein [Paecilomyces variotii No. 5]
MTTHNNPTLTGAGQTPEKQNTIPASFESRKRKILAELSVPDAEYTDLSPKGSVDEGIRDLIHDINTVAGLVTTSSCAGRVSVFLEGRKKKEKKEKQKTDTATSSNLTAKSTDTAINQNKKSNEDDEEGKFEDDNDDTERQFASAGGKGGGRWLYVSHDPVKVTETGDAVDSPSFHELFGLVPGDGSLASTDRKKNGLRLVHFRFEPMILHIMSATLHHAQPILTAAFSAGFRESGLQSLRCLSDDMETSPIVAVRSSGLSLESIIGYCDDNSTNDDGSPIIRSLVTEEYLRMLVGLANERFTVNIERVQRFRTKLLDLISVSDDAHRNGGKGRTKPVGWEDEATRRERKRAEGLARQKALLEARGKAGADNALHEAGDEQNAVVFE